MTATAHATLDGTAASSGRLSSAASGVLEFVWPMYLTLVFTLGAWVLVPTVVLGWQPVTIISGSMAPAVQPGHVVIVEPFADQDLGPGTVVTYRDAAQDRFVTHRITAVEEDGTFTTRGDANAVDDREPLTADRIVGVGRLVVPAAGLPALWAHQDRTDLLAVVAVLTVLATGAAASAASAGARAAGRRLSLRGGTSSPPRVRTIGAAVGVLAVVAVLGTTVVSRAAFVGAEDNASNTFTAASIAPPPDLRATCVASGLLSRRVELAWDPVPGAAAYEIQRSTLLPPSYQTIATVTTTSYADTVSLTLLSSASYRVRAVDPPWSSAFSTLTQICV